MRSVPIAEFAENATGFVLAAKAGEDVVITRHGKPMATLTAVDPDGGAAQREEERATALREEERKARQRQAIDALFEAGRARRAAGRPGATNDEIIAWIKEDQR